MGYLCAICYASLDNTPTCLCSACQSSLPRSELSGSIYQYQDAIRTLILRTKVHGDRYALTALRQLFVSSPQLEKTCARVQQIVPVPSSLWGRLRGRIDIAWFLANDAAKKFSLPLRLAPSALYWRINKQALNRRNCRYPLNFPEPKASIQTLLIDDIVTTGFTLQRVASQLRDASCIYLTLAEAYTFSSSSLSSSEANYG